MIDVDKNISINIIADGQHLAQSIEKIPASFNSYKLIFMDIQMLSVNSYKEGV